MAQQRREREPEAGPEEPRTRRRRGCTRWHGGSVAGGGPVDPRAGRSRPTGHNATPPRQHLPRRPAPHRSQHLAQM